MAKQPATVVHVRFPAGAYEKLQGLADAHGGTVHSEVVKAVEAYIAAEEDTDVVEIKTATLAMLQASHLGLGDAMPHAWNVAQFKIAMGILFDALSVALKVEEPSAEQRKYAEVAAAIVLAEMRSDCDTPLGNAGRALGMAGELGK